MIKDRKPAFRKSGWMKHNENCISGCSYGCRYCNAKTTAIKFRRKTAETWQQEAAYMNKVSKLFTKRDARFMFPTSHDITPGNLVQSIAFLSNILRPGNNVLVVSKPHLDCIRNICETFHQYKQNILFRFTIGSADNRTLRFWDQYAPSFDERLLALFFAHEAGFQTGVSCEPMLDDKADILIKKVLPYVTDAIWLGKGKQMIARLKMNGHGDETTMQRAQQLIDSQSDEYIQTLYERWKDNPQIKWKKSIKKIVGIETPFESWFDSYI